MRLSTVEIVSREIKRQPPVVTQDRRGAWAEMMQDMLEESGANKHFHGDFPIELGNLHVQVIRNNTALAAIWTVGVWDEKKPHDIAATSVVLAGDDENDDEHALQLFLSIPGMQEFPADKLADIRNRPRPSLGAVYFDPALYESGIAQLAVNGLALAYIAGPGAIVKR